MRFRILLVTALIMLMAFVCLMIVPIDLAEQGYQVVRIPGYEVLRDAAGVRRPIEAAIDNRIE